MWNLKQMRHFEGITGSPKNWDLLGFMFCKKPTEHIMLFVYSNDPITKIDPVTTSRNL